MVAEKGPLARAFARIVKEYKGVDVNPHDIVADPEARRQIMSEVLAHEAGKYQDQDWVQKAWYGVKRALSTIPGLDLTKRDDYMQRLVDAGAKHLKERAQEDWSQKDLTSEQRGEIRANRRAWAQSADETDKTIPFRRPPTSRITEDERSNLRGPERWLAGPESGVPRSRDARVATTLPNGSVDEPAFPPGSLNALYSRAKARGFDIDYDALSAAHPWSQPGGEHVTTYVPTGDRYIKITNPGYGGLKSHVYPDGSLHLGEAGLEEYIKRRAAWNKFFGDKILIHGVTKDKDGNVRVVSSQPAIHEIRTRTSWTIRPATSRGWTG